MDYVKKQSLLEQQHRQATDKGKAPAGDEPTDEQLELAMKRSLED